MALRVGMVGAGMISEFHLRGWSRVAGAEVVAICDSDPARAGLRATQFGIPASYAQLEEMIAREAISAVDIATPLETHAELVTRAAAMGVPVMCQKPLAPTLDEARSLAQIVEGRARLMVHENWRFRPYYRQVGQWLRSGELGRPTQVTMSAMSSGMIAGPDGLRPALVREPALRTSSHLVVGTLLIHHLDVLRYLLGPLRLVHATLRREVAEVRAETLATVALETADGVPVVLSGNMAVHGAPTYIRDEMVLTGTAGSVRLFDGHLEVAGQGLMQTLHWQQDVAYQAAFDGAIRHFAEAVVSGAPFESQLEDNLASVALVQEILDKYPISLANQVKGPDRGGKDRIA